MRWSRLASLSLAVALVGPVAAHSSVPAAPDGLRGLPNVAITYYEVLGTDITSLNRAVKEHAGPTGKRAASTDWTLAVRFDKRRTGEQCVIADATIEFSAKAALPRLANEQAVPPAVLAAWRKYLAALESESSAKLHFVYERTDEIEQAFEGKSCEQGRLDGGRAIAQLEQDYATFESRSQTSPLALSSASPTEDDTITCKTLPGDKKGKPVCMSNRDWATLGQFGE